MWYTLYITSYIYTCNFDIYNMCLLHDFLISCSATIAWYLHMKNVC